MTSFKKIATFFLFPPLLIPAALKNEGKHGKASRAASIAYGGYYSLMLVAAAGNAIVNPLPPVDTDNAPKVTTTASPKAEQKPPTVKPSVVPSVVPLIDPAIANAVAEGNAQAKKAESDRKLWEAGQAKRDGEAAARAKEVSDRALWTSDKPNAIVKADAVQVMDGLGMRRLGLLKAGQGVKFTGEVVDGLAIIESINGMRGRVPASSLKPATVAQVLGQ